MVYGMHIPSSPPSSGVVAPKLHMSPARYKRHNPPEEDYIAHIPYSGAPCSNKLVSSSYQGHSNKLHIHLRLRLQQPPYSFGWTHQVHHVSASKPCSDEYLIDINTYLCTSQSCCWRILHITKTISETTSGIIIDPKMPLYTSSVLWMTGSRTWPLLTRNSEEQSESQMCLRWAGECPSRCLDYKFYWDESRLRRTVAEPPPIRSSSWTETARERRGKRQILRFPKRLPFTEWISKPYIQQQQSNWTMYIR